MHITATGTNHIVGAAERFAVACLAAISKLRSKRMQPNRTTMSWDFVDYEWDAVDSDAKKLQRSCT